MSAERRLAVAPDSPDGAYMEVYRPIAHDILKGAFHPVGRLPSERTLCETYGVSRETVRRALAKLAEDELIISARGRGWFVRHRMSEPANTLLSFTDLAKSFGATSSSRVLRMDVRAATFDEAEQFGIPPGVAIFELRRVRLFDDLPIAVAHSVVPLARAPNLPELDWRSASLFDALKESGAVSSWAAVSVSAESANAAVARALKIRTGEPVLAVSDTTHDQHHAVMERGSVIYRADRYKLQATLTRMLD